MQNQQNLTPAKLISHLNTHRQAFAAINNKELQRLCDRIDLYQITLENFLKSLSELERGYVQRRVIGQPVKEIQEKFNLSKNDLKDLKKNIKFKLKEVYI